MANKVKIKRLNDLAKIPTRGSEYAAGYDLYAATAYDIEIPPHKTVKIGTGLAIELEENTFGAIFARSGLSCKQNLRLANAVGVIDSDYYENQDNDGHIMFQFINLLPFDIVLNKGEKIGQGVFAKFLKADNDTSDGERVSGFGSTGN